MNHKIRCLTLHFLLSCATGISFAAVQLADTPIPVELNSNQVQPNIMFTLDDSGSMKFETLPDKNGVYLVFPPPSGNIYGTEYYDSSFDTVAPFEISNRYARYFRTARFNPNYYNPETTYLPWSKADGTLMDNAIPTKAYHNPANTSEGYRNLTANFTSSGPWKLDNGNLSTTSKSYFPATYFRYTGTHTAETMPDPSDTGRNIQSHFTLVEIKAATTSYPKAAGRTDCAGTTTCTYNEEIQNFANWYTHYRSRILASRAGIGKAFSGLNDRVRVGFAAINKGSATIDGATSPGTVITGVKQFTGTNRTAWFNALYGHTIPNSGTPLRRAMDDVGQYFMRTDNNGPWGPAPQYSCRQSYNIFMTDGYWTADSASQARTSAARANVDNSDGPKIPHPNGESYQYKPEWPYKDAEDNSLADVAMYYWNRDLRPDLTNDVPKNNKDPAYWQHMVNFTVGLGVTGTDHADGVWPANIDTEPEKIDDLEHAAKNSRGDFFNAANPEQFAQDLRDALNDIAGRNNTFASNAVSNPNIDPVDNFTYSSSYNPADWSGDINAYTYDLSTGKPGKDSLWTASPQKLLDLQTTSSSDTRLIATYNGTAGIGFQWDSLTSAQQTSLGTQGVLQFLRGWRDEEGTTYRRRDHLLGDIVNAEPVVVSAARYHYNDAGYSDFSSAVSSRRRTLYQGANDGMLHAFDATVGESNSAMELWAYVPNLLMGKLKDLSSVNFTHKYYVDGTPVQADVDFKNTKDPTDQAPNWRTILVGGLGKGGRGYYALDVTSQAAANEEEVAAKVLWEFTDADLGFSFGKPIVTKTRAHGWVVLLTSGYNNVPAANDGAAGSTTGDGKGYLYVLNARTGSLIKKIPVPMNPDTTDSYYLANPIGFTHIAGFVDDTDIDNTVDLVYGGDLNGDVWRFDLSAADDTRWAVSKFAVLRNASNQVQPVTAVPETAYVMFSGAKKRMVYVGTGKYLGTTDVNNTDRQSIYGLKDAGNLANNNFVSGVATSVPAATINVRDGSLVGQTLTVTSPTERSATHDPVNLNTKNGWYVDLPVSKERAYTDPQLQYGVLSFTTNIPDDSPCSIYGGSSWLNYLDYATGGAIKLASGTYATAGRYLGNMLASRGTIIWINGKPYVTGTNTDGSIFNFELPTPGTSKRVSWREVVSN